MNELRGVGTLVRLALRRDRVKLPLCVAAMVAFAAVSASSTKKLYSTQESRLKFAAGAAHNPATHALYGPPNDLGTLGGLATWKMVTLGALLVGLICAFAVVRHTRGDEETGRAELLGAGVVGRRAPLAAGLVVAFGTALTLVPLIALGLIPSGIPAPDAFGFGFEMAGAGSIFAAVAAAAAQLTQTSKAANGIAAGVLGVSYLLRAAGDSAGADGPRWLTWLSPLGWTEKMRPFGDTRWWLLGVWLAATIVVTGAAVIVVARRDLGAGVLPARAGRERAGSLLRGSFGLAWRLHRGVLLGWGVAYAVVGAAVGGIAHSVGDLVGDDPGSRELFAKLGGSSGVVDSFLSAETGLLGIACAAYAVQATLRLRSEETNLLAEQLLATRCKRIAWLASHVGCAVLGTGFLLIVGGLAAGIVHGNVGLLLGAAAARIPAACVLAGVVVALFGVLPRAVGAAWAVLALFLVASEFGSLLDLDHRVRDISPFTHVPDLPGATFRATPIVWLTLVVFALVGIGLAGFRRRDVG